MSSRARARHTGDGTRTRGRVGNWIEEGFTGLGTMRTVPTSVNRQPAVAFYHWRERERAYPPLTIDVLRIAGGAITEIVTFHEDRFPALGLPERLPATGTERSRNGRGAA